MAVRGAVAEKHLERVLKKLLEEGKIKGYRTASSDFDKDFEVLCTSDKKIVLECKNVEVIKFNSKASKSKYLSFLLNAGLIKDVPEDFQELPQKFRESGLERYRYSKSLLDGKPRPQIGDCSQWLTTIQSATVDFQRTRNSTATKDPTVPARALRFYENGEIDILAVCLFARTLTWQFVYTTKAGGAMKAHKTHIGRYSNRLKLNDGVWYSDLISAINELESC